MAFYLNSELLQAAERGDHSTVRSALRRGANVHAIRKNLIFRAIDSNFELQGSATALQLAAWCGHESVLRELVAHGAIVPNAQRHPPGQRQPSQPPQQRATEDDHLPPALHLACMRGHLELVRCMLENNVHPDLTDEYLFSALHRSAAANQPQICKLLIEYGCDCNLPNVRVSLLAIERAQESMCVLRDLWRTGSRNARRAPGTHARGRSRLAHAYLPMERRAPRHCPAANTTHHPHAGMDTTL